MEASLARVRQVLDRLSSSHHSNPLPTFFLTLRFVDIQLTSAFVLFSNQRCPSLIRDSPLTQSGSTLTWFRTLLVGTQTIKSPLVGPCPVENSIDLQHRRRFSGTSASSNVVSKQLQILAPHIDRTRSVLSRDSINDLPQRTPYTSIVIMSDLEKSLTQIALNPAYHDFFTILKVSMTLSACQPSIALVS